MKWLIRQQQILRTSWSTRHRCAFAPFLRGSITALVMLVQVPSVLTCIMWLNGMGGSKSVTVGSEEGGGERDHLLLLIPPPRPAQTLISFCVILNYCFAGFLMLARPIDGHRWADGMFFVSIANNLTCVPLFPSTTRPQLTNSPLCSAGRRWR
jgi:hypothetical protein